MRSKFYCRVVIFLLAALFLNTQFVYSQNPCGNSSPTTQPTNFQISNRNQNGFDINFSVDNAANAFAILRSTSSTPVNLSSLVNGTDITVGQTIDNSTVIFLSQTRNAYNTASLYNYGMRYENVWAWNQQTESFIYRESSLTPNTEYYYTIISFNACDLNTDTSPNNILPHHYQYNKVNPLTGSTATCLATPDRTQISLSNRTGTGFELTIPKIDGASSYSLFAYTNHGLSNSVSGSPFNTTAFSAATGTISATGIAANTILYYKVVANPSNSNVCSSAPSHAAYSYRFAVPGDLNSQYIDNKVIIGCPAPTQMPTNLVTTMQQSGVENYISASFTGTSEASGYIVLHSSSNNPPTIPDGASKPSIGGSSQNILIGGNYYWVTSNTSATSVSNKSLGGVYGTTIYTWVIPYTQCADGTYKFYNSTPLTNTIVGCPSSPLTWSTTNATSTSFSVTFPFGGNNKVDVSTASDFSSFITNSPFSVTNTSANTISGLSPSTTYYARSYTVGSSCNSSYSSTKTISTLSPVVSSVSVTNGTYLYNSNIDIVVATNLSITPVRTGGVPSIDITIGSNVRQAVLVNTTASSSLTFRYTVQSSDVDADGISIGSTINLNQGTLKDAGGTNLNLALNSVASTTAVLVDGVPGPALTSLALVGTSSGTALTISYTATFDNSVSGVTSNTFATSYSGNLSGATISSITGSGAVYTINLTLTAPAVSGSGTVYLYLKSNQTSIVDASGKSTISLSQVNGTTYTYTPTAITIPAPSISTTSYLSKYFVDASSDKVGINFPITLPTTGTLPSGTRYNASSWNDAQLEFSFDGTSWTALTTGANYQTIAGVAYKYVDNATARAYQLMIVPISPGAPTVYVRARTKVEDSVNGTFLYSDWTAANQLFSPPPPAVSSARLVLANGVYNVEVTMDKYDANQSVVSFERKQKVLGAANFSTVTIASSNSGFNSNGYGRGGAAGTVYTNYNWNYDLNLYTGNVYQFEVTPIFANSVRGTTYVFAQYLSNGTNSVTGTSLNHAIAVNVDLNNVLTQVSGATLVSTRYQFGLYTAPSTLSYVTTSTVVGTNASTILSSNSNGALVNGSTYRVLGIATLSASGVSFSVPLAFVDVIPNPPALTITGLTGVNKEYDGNRTATTTGTALLNGVANGHTVTLSGTPVFQFADATIANGKAITVTGYTLSGANAADYSLVQPTGLTANITTKALTITGITGVNKLYDGLSSATLTGTATLSGVVGSESVTLTSPSTFNFASAGVGNGIAITPTTNYSISGTDAAHYTITQPSSLSANIAQKGLTISGLSAANKEYNGNTNVDVSGTAAYVGLENGESFAIAGSPTYSFSDASVGNNKAINISGFLAPSANYSISQPTLTASITGKALSITATGPIMTVGTALTAGTYSTNFTANGTITGEAVTSVTLTPDAAGLSAISPSGTSYLVTPSLATGSGGFLASNYNITYNAYSGIVAGPPVVSSINRVSAANTNQTTINYTVTFDKAVTGVDVNDFQVTNSGATTATIASISGTAATYTVVLNTISGDGTIRLDLKNSGTGIQDLEGRAIVSGFTSGQVYTVDQTNPTLGTVTVSSSNANASQAKVGDVITLNIVAGEAIQTPTVTIAGQAASVTGTGSTYAATYTVTSNTPQGTASISVSYSDLANNPGIGVTSTTNNSAVVVDTQIPTLGTVSVSSNNTNTSQAKVGDLITVNIVAAEAIQTPTVTIAGQAATVTGTGSTYAATYTVTSNTPQGTTSISVTYSDIANNAGIAVTSTTNNSSVVVDTAVPTLGTVSVSSSNANTSKAKIGDVITVNIVASEAIQNPIVTVAGQAALVTGTGSTYAATYTVTSNTSQGTTSISVTYSDIANNAGIAVTSTTNSSSVVVDIQAPTGYSFVINQQAVTIQNQNAISVNLTGAEVGTNFRITSNVGSSTISTIGIISSANQVISNLDLTNLPDGNVQMALVLTDASGNAGGTYSQTINKDALFPTVSNVSSSLANGNYTIGQVVPIIVSFSEVVNVTGTPVLSLSTGQLSPTQVSYVSGNSSTDLVFNYVISGGQNIADLAYSSTNALSLNGGTIVDNGNNAAILTLPAIGAAGSLDNNAAIVVDTQVPTLGTVSVSSSNTNNSKAKVGDVITVNIVAGEAIQTPTVTVAGHAATVTGTGSTYTATYTITNNTPQGTASISVTYSDVADNPGTAVTSTTNSSTVVVDTAVPTLGTVSISSSNTNTSQAKVGDVITVNIVAGEAIQTPTVTVAGQAATVTGTGSTYAATYTVTSNTPQGTASISVTYSDVADNPGTAVTSTTNSSTVVVDTAVPTLGTVSVSSSNANTSSAKVGDVITVNILAGEAIQTPTVTVAGQAATVTGTGSTYAATYTVTSNTPQGTATISVTYSDVANNPGTAVTSTTNSSTVVVDTAVPTLGTVSVSSSNANNSKAKVGDVITVNIVAGEAIQTPTVTVAGQAASVTGTGSTYAATYTVTSNTPQGTASISVTYSDVANNLGTAVTSTTNSSTVLVDNQAPAGYAADWNITTINNDNFRNVGFTLTNAELGATYSYTISSGTSSITASGTVTNSTQVIEDINTSTLRDGIITLSLTIIDQAGNSGLAVTDTINKATNGGPTGTPTPITLSQNAPDQTINLLEGIADPEGDPLTVSNVTISYSIENVVTNQPVVINSTLLTKFQDVVSTADLTGTNLFIEMSKSKFLNGSQKGQINIAYVVTDGNNSLNANAVLNIIGANDQPTGAAVTLNQVVINGQNMGIPLTEGVGVSTNVPGIDPDDDSVTYTLDQNTTVSNGQFVFNPDGSFSFLPDANYYGEQEFDYYIKDQSGVLNGPYKVKIVIAENPDIDGIPSKLEEVAPNGGDVNGDGIPDRKQNNITNVPLGSYADFKAGIDWANGVPGATRPSTSKVGSLLIGSLPGGKSGLDSLDLDPNAKFRNVALLPTPNIANTDRQFSSDLYQFTIEGLLTNAADTLSPRLPLRDLDPARPGLQVRAVLEFPVGMRGSTYLKQNKAGEWKSFKDDQKLSTYDDGATLIDLDNDPSTIERIVLTFTDGAFGDKDTLVNNSISDPGGLGIIKPVVDDAVLPTRAEGVATATTLFNVFDRNSRLDVDEEGQKLYYTIDSTNNSAAVRAAVKIDSLTGVISVRDAGGFDYESFVDANGLAQFRIVVKATDTDGNFDLATYTQTITNVDEYPRIISGKTVSYREKQPTTVAVIRVQTLPDYQDLTSFSILPGLDGSFFTIDPATGVLRFKNSPNYDDKPVYTLDIQSQDLSGKTDHAVFTVNIIDIDADNDGILDDEEIGPDPLHPIDTDKDGIPDYKDTDSDGDGIPDLFESKADTDKDGIPDYLDTDSDGDGILDKIEAGPNPLKPLDSDGDGIPDFRELDADNDGYLDSYEKSIDTDKDGIPDCQDTDSDGDGILDKVEDDLDFGNIKDCDHDGIENRIDPDVCDLILPQIITPNGDGLNDVLKIPGIMRLQPNHITIINRWGAVVYDAENYQNTWGGTGDSGELPDGTYYYVVDFKGAKPTISNFIYLDRTGK